MPVHEATAEMSRVCTASKTDGTPCTNYSSVKHFEQTGESLCAGHAGLGVATGAYAREGARASAEVRTHSAQARREAVERSKMSTRERLAQVLEELQDEVAAAYSRAIETGDPEDLRRVDAAERLLSRVHGRPIQPNATVSIEDDREAELRLLSIDRLLEIRDKLMAEDRLDHPVPEPTSDTRDQESRRRK
jgi:hypothetical protein